MNGKRHASPHLFLSMEIEQGILLSSYEIPKGEDKNTFSKDGIWEGGSTSQFSPVMTFKLGERSVIG